MIFNHEVNFSNLRNIVTNFLISFEIDLFDKTNSFFLLSIYSLL